MGTGSIAEAMLEGITNQELLKPKDIYVINRINDDRLNFFQEKYGICTTRDYQEIVSNCKYLIIAVKPRDVSELLITLRKLVTENHVIITLVAGIKHRFC